MLTQDLIIRLSDLQKITVPTAILLRGLRLEAVPLKIPAEVQVVMAVTTVIPVLAPRGEDHLEV